MASWKTKMDKFTVNSIIESGNKRSKEMQEETGKQMNAKKMKKIDIAHNTIKDQEHILKTLEQSTEITLKITKLVERISDLHEQVNNKDKEIARLNAEIVAIKENIKQAEETKKKWKNI